MTRKQIEQIVAFWKPKLYLTHWDVRIMWDEDPEEELKKGHAYIWRSRDYDEAKLYLNPDFVKWGKKEAHQHVVHELTHLVTRDFEFVIDMLDGQLHRDVDKVVIETHRHHMEQAVDRLARAFVDLAGIED